MRKRVQLTFIASDNARKATYKKRKRGLLKKMDELTTLCGVEGCAMICSSYEPAPVVWPDPERALSVVKEFRQLPEIEQHRKMLDQPQYLNDRIKKASAQLERLQEENRKREVALTMYAFAAGQPGLNQLSPTDLKALDTMIDKSLEHINSRLENGVVGGYEKAPVQEEPFPLPLSGQEVVPGFGFGSTNQMLGTPIWPVGQYYQVAPGGFGSADAGASGSGCAAGDNEPFQLPPPGLQEMGGGFGSTGWQTQVGTPTWPVGQSYQVAPGGFGFADAGASGGGAGDYVPMGGFAGAAIGSGGAAGFGENVPPGLGGFFNH